MLASDVQQSTQAEQVSYRICHADNDVHLSEIHFDVTPVNAEAKEQPVRKC